MATVHQPKVGMLYARPQKGVQLEQVQVELKEDRLVVQKCDVVYEDIMAKNEITDDRRVLLERGERGLGVAIQGGMDFKMPIKVLKVIEDSPAAISGQIQDGDVILDVNGTVLWGKTHDEAADILKNAGKFVTIHVGKLQPKQEDHDGQVGQAVHSWVPMVEVPLTLASVTRYHKGTAILKPNTFQVLSRDRSAKVNLHCDDRVPEQLQEWPTAITERISYLNKQEMNKCNSVITERNEQIILMGWAYEQLPSTVHTNVWQRKFLALKRMQFQIFNSYPESVQEWLRPEKSYKLLEMTVRVLKAHELPEQRANSVVLTSGIEGNHIISFETQPVLTEWTRTIHNTTVEAVMHLQQQQFLGRWRGEGVYFSVDINQGFVIYDRSNLSLLWSKCFHWLKKSSDDGHSRLHLEFGVANSQLPESQDLELEDLQAVICAMESFLAAKVALLDPNFVLQTDMVTQE